MTEEYGNDTHTGFILEAIFEIKRRKHGVNENHICDIVKQWYGVPEHEVQTHLQHLVKNNVLVVKERDGLKCYRIIDKHPINKNRMSGMETQLQNLSKAILEVIREVKYGVSALHIHQRVNKVQGLTDVSLEDVLTAIRIENELGTIRERLNGLYCSTSRQTKRRKFDGYYLSDEENLEEAKTNAKKKKKQVKVNYSI